MRLMVKELLGRAVTIGELCEELRPEVCLAALLRYGWEYLSFQIGPLHSRAPSLHLQAIQGTLDWPDDISIVRPMCPLRHV